MSSSVTSEFLWTQRSSSSEPEQNYVYVTISVPDVPFNSLKFDLEPTGLTFTGASDSKKTRYHLDMDFYGEFDVEL
ncbi:p23 chaperone protein wos2 [Exophiala xenobiotica]|nr:p23 chaperone protein wos2 [Exophiala xenobiotica]